MTAFDPLESVPATRPGMPEQPRGWLATAGVLLAGAAIMVVATAAGSLAASALDWWTDIDTPRAYPAGALQTYAAIRLAVFLGVFQLTALAATLLSARAFRGDRVAFMALSYRPNGVVTALPYIAGLLAMAAVYAGVVLLQDRDALLGDIQLLSEMIRSDGWWMIALAAIIGAPIAEEVLFRGLMFGVLRAGPLGVVAAAGITAVLWASVHGQYSLYGIVGIGLIGLYLAWVREKTGSLVAPILCHAAYNGAIIAVMMLLPEHLMQMG